MERENVSMDWKIQYVLKTPILLKCRHAYSKTYMKSHRPYNSSKDLDRKK